MTSQIPKISGDCRKIKLQNFSILRYYSSICATHTLLCCNKLFETAFYSLSVKKLCLSSLSSAVTMTVDDGQNSTTWLLLLLNSWLRFLSSRKPLQEAKCIPCRWHLRGLWATTSDENLCCSLQT